MVIFHGHARRRILPVPPCSFLGSRSVCFRPFVGRCRAALRCPRRPFPGFPESFREVRERFREIPEGFREAPERFREAPEGFREARKCPSGGAQIWALFAGFPPDCVPSHPFCLLNLAGVRHLNRRSVCFFFFFAGRFFKNEGGGGGGRACVRLMLTRQGRRRGVWWGP